MTDYKTFVPKVEGLDIDSNFNFYLTEKDSVVYFNCQEDLDMFLELVEKYKKLSSNVKSIEKSPAFKKLVQKQRENEKRRDKLDKEIRKREKEASKNYLNGGDTYPEYSYSSYNGKIETNIRSEVFETLKSFGILKSYLTCGQIKEFVEKLIETEVDKGKLEKEENMLWEENSKYDKEMEKLTECLTEEMDNIEIKIRRIPKKYTAISPDESEERKKKVDARKQCQTKRYEVSDKLDEIMDNKKKMENFKKAQRMLLDAIGE